MTTKGMRCVLTLLIGLGTASLATGQDAGAPPGKVTLAPAERVLVMQVRDLLVAGGIIDGSGGAVVQAVHNSLAALELSPQPGSYAAVANALDESRELACPFAVRPLLERYRGGGGVRSKIRFSLDLIDTVSGDVVASCADVQLGRDLKGRAQELLRPAVETCLRQIIDVSADPASGQAGEPAVARDRFLVVPNRELWLLTSDDESPLDERTADLVIESLLDATAEGLRSPPELDRREVYSHARSEGYRRMIAVGVGLVWTSMEPPPSDAPRQMILSVIDVASKRTLQTVVLESTDPFWDRPGSDRLPAMVDFGVRKILGSRDDAAGATPDGVTFSMLEPATIIQKSWPRYPRSARRELVDGNVVLQLVVDVHGEVADVQVIESVPELDKAAIKAARRLRFVPARRDGEVVPMYMHSRHEFEIR